MSLIRSRLAVVILWVLSLVAVGSFVHAQGRNATPPADAALFSGADIGFQAYDTGGKTVIGKLVIRVNGQWKDAEFVPVRRIQPLSVK